MTEVKVGYEDGAEELILRMLDKENRAKDVPEKAHFRFQRLTLPAVKDAAEQVHEMYARAIEAEPGKYQDSDFANSLLCGMAAADMMIFTNCLQGLYVEARGMAAAALIKRYFKILSTMFPDYLEQLNVNSPTPPMPEELMAQMQKDCEEQKLETLDEIKSVLKARGHGPASQSQAN